MIAPEAFRESARPWRLGSSATFENRLNIVPTRPGIKRRMATRKTGAMAMPARRRRGDQTQNKMINSARTASIARDSDIGRATPMTIVINHQRPFRRLATNVK